MVKSHCKGKGMEVLGTVNGMWGQKYECLRVLLCWLFCMVVVLEHYLRGCSGNEVLENSSWHDSERCRNRKSAGKGRSRAAKLAWTCKMRNERMMKGNVYIWCRRCKIEEKTEKEGEMVLRYITLDCKGRRMNGM